MAASQRVGGNYSPWSGGEALADEPENACGFLERATAIDDRSIASRPATASADAPGKSHPFGCSPGAPTGEPGAKRTAETNGQRTTAREAAPFAETAVTSSGDSIYVAGAAIKGRESNSGIEVEVFTASAQIGGQFEAQVGAARLGASSDDGANAVGMDVFTARAAMGVHNTDGSFGWNAGALATAIGAEGTLRLGTASSVTGGGAIGVGLEGSLGLRDADGDNRPEVCGRLVLGPVTAGLCVEMPFSIPELAPKPRTTAK